MSSILAFDQASVNSGWSFFIDGEYQQSGVIEKNSRTPIDIRIQEMAQSICQKIKELKPDIVIIEDVQGQSNISTMIQLARLQGAIMFYCHSKGVQFNILAPTQWRSVLGYKLGKGVKRQELKQQSMDYVKDHLKFNIESEDEAESCCINMAAQKIITRQND